MAEAWHFFVWVSFTELVLDYVVKFKFCESCRYWKSEYLILEIIDQKERHASQCKRDINGSAASMVALGTLGILLKFDK